jgi:hypothetical protein
MNVKTSWKLRSRSVHAGATRRPYVLDELTEDRLARAIAAARKGRAMERPAA